MTPEATLQQVIEKAIRNGWQKPSWFYEHDLWYADAGSSKPNALTDIIFSHEFCKAFWVRQGEACHCGQYGHPLNSINCAVHGWTYHLQQLALSEDRLAYLATFLP